MIYSVNCNVVCSETESVYMYTQNVVFGVLGCRHLQLGGNMFRNPRPAVLARGTAELLQYLRDRIPT